MLRGIAELMSFGEQLELHQLGNTTNPSLSTDCSMVYV